MDALGRDNRLFGLRCEDESLTVQSDAIDADINTIVRRFGITGELPTELPFVTNVDLSEAPDTYMGAIAILDQARDQFMKMPADVRSRFQNDPGLFMDFVSNPANLDEMRKLGLAVPKPGDPVEARVAELERDAEATSRVALRRRVKDAAAEPAKGPPV